MEATNSLPPNTRLFVHGTSACYHSATDMVIGPLIALFIILTASLLIVRLGTMSLMMTGLSWDIANFQAYSSFFGVGFTTSEAEHVVNHPLRRRIIRDLILCGNVGLTSALATVIITFLDVKSGANAAQTLGTLAGGIVLLVLLTKIGAVRRIIDWAIRRSLERVGALNVADYDLLLRVQSGYCVSEVEIAAGTEIADRVLGDSRPADRGIIVLGITKKGGHFIGAPNRHEHVEPGDILLIYGNEEAIQELHARHAQTSS